MKKLLLNVFLLIIVLTSCEINNYYDTENEPEQLELTLPSLNDGLISSYDFSIDDNIIVNGATLTYDRFGNEKSAYTFDGVDDLITLNLNKQLKNMTVSLWYKPFQPKSWYPQLFRVGELEFILMAGNHVAYKNNNNVGHIGSYPSGLNSIPFIPTFNQWHNLIVTYNHDKNIHSIHIDGVLYRHTTTNGYLYVSGNVYVGNTKSGRSADGSAGYYGDMDDIKIWERDLTQDEIEYLSKN